MESYCGCAMNDPWNKKYHDEEWGVPLFDDDRQFEYLSMEVMQCGLSWVTVLKKREALRAAFDDFKDIRKIANYSDEDVTRMLGVPGIIKSPRKLRAIVNNAKCFLEVQKEFGSFSNYIWGFTDHKMLVYDRKKIPEPTENDISRRLAGDLKKRGFKYLGPVVVFSHLQADGQINDHDHDCPLYGKYLKMAEHEIIDDPSLV